MKPMSQYPNFSEPNILISDLQWAISNIQISNYQYPLLFGNIQYPVSRGAGPQIILSRASEMGSPTNHLGSRQRRDTGQGSSSSLTDGRILTPTGEPPTCVVSQRLLWIYCHVPARRGLRRIALSPGSDETRTKGLFSPLIRFT